MQRLAALEPSPFPVISLYLSLTSNQNGNGREERGAVPFRKVFNERAKGIPEASPERESFDQEA